MVISEVTGGEDNLSFVSESSEIESLVKYVLLRDCLLFMIPKALRQLRSHADETAAGKARKMERKELEKLKHYKCKMERAGSKVRTA